MATYKLLKSIEKNSIPVGNTVELGEYYTMGFSYIGHCIPTQWLLEHGYLEEVKNTTIHSFNVRGLMDLLTEKVTRFEVIDHRNIDDNKKGRVYVAKGFIDVELILQDDYTTLKVFISDKTDD